jgi:tRNA nucleotidyltransferase (CCA-adding enzyme)
MAVQLFLSVSNVQERKCLLDPVDKKRNALARLRLERWAVEMNLES